MSATKSKKTWIQLQMGDPALGGVTVHSRDGNVLALSKQMIARSGQIAYRIQEFEDQLAALQQELERWASQQAVTVQEVFLVLKGDHFLFLVILKGKAYNAELEDALTDLDVRIAQDPEFNLINLSVLALPAFAEDAIRSFLPQRASIEDTTEDAERDEPPFARES